MTKVLCEALVRALGYGKTSPYEIYAARLLEAHQRKVSAEEMEILTLDAIENPPEEAAQLGRVGGPVGEKGSLVARS